MSIGYISFILQVRLSGLLRSRGVIVFARRSHMPGRGARVLAIYYIDIHIGHAKMIPSLKFSKAVMR